jgi:hypothetical protein
MPFLMTPPTIACTIFTASHGESVFFGANEDQRPNSSFLVVDKRGTLGVVYFATPWKKWPLVMQMGINEMGLSFDNNWIMKEKLTPHPERTPQYEWAVTQLMQQASTVEEVLAKIFTYNWGDSISYQIHFADKSGDAVVIHPGADDELTYSRKPKGNGYLISTNFNLANLDKKMWSFLRYRYKTADEMLSTIGTQNNLTVAFMASVLKATHQKWIFKTLYSVVYDLSKLRIYLYFDRQFDTPYNIDVKSELATTTEVYRKIPLEELVSNGGKDKKN